jgi:hypothetical protein
MYMGVHTPYNPASWTLVGTQQMARHKRSSALETRAARLRLAVRRKPYFLLIAPRVGLGYRRNQGPGTWVARGADGHGGYWTKAIGLADDNEDADGGAVLNYWQAQDKAKTVVRGGAASGERPLTVAEALVRYQTDLRARGSSLKNASRITLPAALAAKSVALLGARELRLWRDAMVTRGLKASTADRTARMLKAALNLTARDDHRISNAAAWRDGLAKLPDAETPRNAILADDVVRSIVAAAYRLNASFGLFKRRRTTFDDAEQPQRPTPPRRAAPRSDLARSRCQTAAGRRWACRA